jgi:hypothetical protein
MTGVVLHPRHLADHLRDPRQGPKLCLVSPGQRTFEQRLHHDLLLRVRQPGLAPCTTRPAQTLLAALGPSPIPAQRRGPRDVQTTRDLCLRETLFEQARRTTPTPFQTLEVSVPHPPPPQRRRIAPVTILCETL